METLMEKIDLKNIDKSNWQTFRFEKIADKISETVDPAKTELDVYVGLEHIDAEDIHIRRKGTPSDVSGGKLRCYPGDIIFGKRRAYQRKAAIVDFDGICSAHAFVFRAKSKVIDPELFPFFLHSDQFMHRMVDISVGGLSPTINWGDLKHQEFLLPPKEQQAHLAELLWAMDEVIEKERAVLERLETFKLSFSKDLFLGLKRYSNRHSAFKQTSLGKIPNEWSVKEVGEVAKVIRGSSPRPKGDPRYYGGPIPRLMGEDVTRDGKYVTPKVDSLTVEGAKLSRPMKKGTLFMICSGNVGLTSFLEVDCCVHDGFIAFPELSKECDADFLYYTFNSQLHRLFQNATHGGVFTNLTTDIIKNFEIVIPPKEEQIFIGHQVSEQDRRIEVVKSKILSSKTLQKSLINQIF